MTGKGRPWSVSTTRRADELLAGLHRPTLGGAPRAVDLDAVARELRVRVRQAPASQAWRGLTRWEDGLPVVYLRDGLAGESRLRFTFAHELGHVLVERARVHDSTLPAGGWDLERLCDAVAGAMLLPADDMRGLARRDSLSIGDFQAMAGAYRVTLSAVAVRLRRVGRPVRMWRFLTPAFGRPRGVVGMRRDQLDELRVGLESQAQLSALPVDREVPIEFSARCAESAVDHEIVGSGYRSSRQVTILIARQDGRHLAWSTDFCSHSRRTAP